METLINYYLLERIEGDAYRMQAQIMSVLSDGNFLVDVFSWISGETLYSKVISIDFIKKCHLFKEHSCFKDCAAEANERILEKERAKDAERKFKILDDIDKTHRRLKHTDARKTD